MARDDRLTTFTSALDTVNAALEQHADEVPFRQILDAADRVLQGRKLGIAVHEDDDEEPHDFFTVRYRDGGFELVGHGERDPDVRTKVPQDYLDEVARNPERYIEHPLKLDLRWLSSRLGL